MLELMLRKSRVSNGMVPEFSQMVIYTELLTHVPAGTGARKAIAPSQSSLIATSVPSFVSPDSIHTFHHVRFCRIAPLQPEGSCSD